jgi:hypothetical protein
MDYGMPRSTTLPSFKTEIVEVLSPTNPPIRPAAKARHARAFAAF